METRFKRFILGLLALVIFYGSLNWLPVMAQADNFSVRLQRHEIAMDNRMKDVEREIERW